MPYGINPNRKEFQGFCLVAFVDILGFSKEIKDNWEDSENNPFDRLKRFVRSVSSNVSKQIKGIRSEASRDTYYGCKIRTFSDSIIITYGFRDKPRKHNFLVGLFYVVYTVSFVWRTALRYGYTIRGGVEYGEMRWDDKTFAGPAFIDAYNIESKYAISSRVVFGKDLTKCICEYLVNKQNTKRFERLTHRHLKEMIRPYLHLDCDKQIILSPHSLYKRQRLSDKNKQIERLITMQNKCTTMDTILKYTPLLNILTSEEKKFSDEDIQVLKNKYDHATPTT